MDGVLLFDEISNDPRGQLLTNLACPSSLWAAPITLKLEVQPPLWINRQMLHGGPGSARSWASADRLYFRPGHVGARARRSAAVVEHAQVVGDLRRCHGVGLHRGRRRTGHHCAMAGLDPASKDFPTALFYGNDLMAVGGLAGLKKLGISVPGQVSVVSWDDSIMCQFSSPPVAALNRDVGELRPPISPAVTGSCSGARAPTMCPCQRRYFAAPVQLGCRAPLGHRNQRIVTFRYLS